MLERIGQLIALGSSACIGFAVLYDWAYFGRIDSRMFFTLTIGDHISGALALIPALVISASISIGLSFRSAATGHSLRSTTPLLPLYEVGGRIFGPHVPRTIPLLIWSGLLVIGMFVSETSTAFFGFLFVIAWFEKLAAPLFEWLRAHASISLCGLLYNGALISMLALSWGWQFAVTDLSRVSGDHTVLLQSEKELANLVLLRSTEQGLYLRDPRTETNFLISWSEIKEVKRGPIERPARIRQFICDWTGLC